MFLLYLKGLLQIILSPRHGWEDASYDGFDERRLTVSGLLPLLAIASLTSYVRLAYTHDADFVILTEHAAVIFAKYFATMIVAQIAFSYYMPLLTDGASTKKHDRTFIAYVIGLQSLVDLTDNCLPMDLPVLWLIPLYAIFVIWRGTRYEMVPYESIGRFLALAVMTLIVPPILIRMLFNMILPYSL